MRWPPGSSPGSAIERTGGGLQHPHRDYHVHRASAEMIEAGLRPERTATINRDFASYAEAVQYFLRATNITDARTYFGDLAQGILPFPEEEPTQ